MISGHCVAFLGVSYFGQILMLWYLMLAIGGFLAEGLQHQNTTFKSSLSLGIQNSYGCINNNNWNTKEITCDCLKSIYRQGGKVDFEIIVIDNG